MLVVASTPPEIYALSERGALRRENWAALDGLRGVSICLVVLVHFWAHASPMGIGIPVKFSLADTALDLTWLFRTGSNGVTVFFALSGFLLFRHWLETSTEVRIRTAITSFYKRRAQRILPAFIFFSALYFLLVGLEGRHHFGASMNPENVILNLTFLSPLAAAAGMNSVSSLDILPGTWSLNPEMWFYVLMPGLAILISRLPGRPVLLIVLSLAAPIYRASLGDNFAFVTRFSLPGVLDPFLLGMAVGSLSANGQIGRLASWLFPFGAIWYFAICADVSPVYVDGPYQLAVASSTMIAGLVAPGDRPWKRLLSGRAITNLGRISYSIFLSNTLVAWYIVLPLWQASGFRSAGSHFLFNMILGSPIVYVIGLSGFRYIEKPFMSHSLRSGLVVVRPAFAISASLLIVSFSLAVLAASTGEVWEPEYSGPVVQFVRNFLPPASAAKESQILGLTGPPVVTSETGHSTIQIEQTAEGNFRITSTKNDTANDWVAIMFPVDLSVVPGGGIVSMNAELQASQTNFMQICLGIYDGQNDNCGRRAALAGLTSLSVRARIVAGGPPQFKFTIFSDRRDEPLDVTLQNMRISQGQR